MADDAVCGMATLPVDERTVDRIECILNHVTRHPSYDGPRNEKWHNRCKAHPIRSSAATVFARCARDLTARRNGRAVEHAVERAGSSNNIAEMALSLSCHLFFPQLRLRADLTKSKNYGDDGGWIRDLPLKCSPESCGRMMGCPKTGDACD